MHEHYKIILGTNIKKFRVERGLQSKELAKLIGVTSENMSNIERAKLTPKFDTICTIAQYLQIEPHKLLIDAQVPNQEYILDDFAILINELDNTNKATLNDILYLILQILNRNHQADNI